MYPTPLPPLAPCGAVQSETSDREHGARGPSEIIVAKQRNVPIVDFRLVFRNDITKFFDYEPQPAFEPV